MIEPSSAYKDGAVLILSTHRCIGGGKAKNALDGNTTGNCVVQCGMTSVSALPQRNVVLQTFDSVLCHIILTQSEPVPVLGMGSSTLDG
ncbi:hypothetical protein ScPMuIL_014167 [Solemya velum]